MVVLISLPHMMLILLGILGGILHHSLFSKKSSGTGQGFLFIGFHSSSSLGKVWSSQLFCTYQFLNICGGGSFEGVEIEMTQLGCQSSHSFTLPLGFKKSYPSMLTALVKLDDIDGDDELMSGIAQADHPFQLVQRLDQV